MNLHEGEPLYDSTIYVIICCCIMIGLGLLVFSSVFFVLTKTTITDRSTRTQYLLRILLVSVVFLACMVCKGVSFLYRPVTGHYMNAILFSFVGYIIPEIIPIVFQTYLIFFRVRRISQSGATVMSRMSKKATCANPDKNNDMDVILEN
eukprot:TRINITY_DN7916_c0_g1_i1.p1 TRINITY_DN7916_c0_g1~~TRINITY_DN7916_c0_g1_i1.p1  ORF type:complete len:149 (-),score=14.98 TRINITY_DN7916_c0_g1_i1:236-682(-)